MRLLTVLVGVVDAVFVRSSSDYSKLRRVEAEGLTRKFDLAVSSVPKGRAPRPALGQLVR